MLIKLVLLALALSTVLTASASLNLYEKYPEIEFLNKTNFRKVYQGTWLVEFYAHWCKHCQDFVPKYVQIAKQLEGIVKTGAINAAVHRTTIPISTVPQIILFVKGKLISFKGAKTVKNVV